LTFLARNAETRITILIIASSISLLVILFPPIEIIENSNLTVRMIEDVLLFVYAGILGYALERRIYLRAKDAYSSTIYQEIYSMIESISVPTRGLLFALLVPSLLVLYWNYPPVFDSTVGNIFLRYQSELSYLAAAILAGASIAFVPQKFRVLLLYLAFMTTGMMGSMMLTWQPGFYTAYSPSQNLAMNTFLMLFGALGAIATSSWLLKIMDVL
jgi:Protein of unknown function (DUF1404)